jgi:hypothetical protein
MYVILHTFYTSAYQYYKDTNKKLALDCGSPNPILEASYNKTGLESPPVLTKSNLQANPVGTPA